MNTPTTDTRTAFNHLPLRNVRRADFARWTGRAAIRAMLNAFNNGAFHSIVAGRVRFVGSHTVAATVNAESGAPVTAVAMEHGRIVWEMGSRVGVCFVD